MPTKISLLIENPARPEALELQVPELLARAGALPDLVRLESVKAWPEEDGTPTPAHRTLDLYFEDHDAASKAVGTSEAGTFFEVPAASEVTFTGLFSEVESD